MSMANLPKHWENAQLKEIASLRRENIKPEDALYSSYVGLEHIDSGESQLKRWGDAAEVKSAKSRFYPDDILYGKLRAYLDKAVIAEMEGICSTDILVVTVNSKTLPRFLVYLLHTHPLISHAVATSTGVNHPRTSWNSLGKFTFALPSLPEQRAIAHILQTIQEAKAARQREFALERERKAALMDYLFSHGTKGEPRKQTEIGEVPESWKIIQLGEIADVRGGASFPKAYQGNTEGKHPFYKVSDMNIAGNETLMQASNNWVEEDAVKMLRAKLFSKNTVIFPKVGAAVHTNKKRLLSCDSLVDNNVMGVTIRDYALCIPYYLLYWFEFVDLVDFSNPGPLPSITANRVKNAKIPLSSLLEQCTIAEILQACDTKIAALEQEAERLDELFHAMLDELMTGQRSAVPLIDSGLLN